jgi:phospho-N-acetylmuramoyl-pentapeptide-transferase
LGGLLFIFPAIFLTLLMNAVEILGLQPIGKSIILPMITLLIYGALGALDDWEKLRKKDIGLGLSARTKFILQIVLSLPIAYILKYILDVPDLYLPGVFREIQLGVFYIPVAAFMIVGFANAVNLTDGMDGLAGLISATCFATFGGIALGQSQLYIAQFCFILVGAVFGFLWFNVHPAKLFMGDTGSLALGATLAVVALMTGHWILLPIVAVIPVSETLSVIIQVGYFKLTGGQRIFKMAPIHLHFELLGWSETQIVQRFWLVSLLFAMIGIGLASI